LDIEWFLRQNEATHLYHYFKGKAEAQSRANRRTMIAEEISGSLDEALTTLKNKPSDNCGVYYLRAACKVPYSPGSKAAENHQVTVFDKSATCVGVGAMADGIVTELLVSDSFYPCVPVIAIGNGRTSLAHFDGLTPGLKDTISERCKANQYSTILVVQREWPPKHITVSDILFNTFGEFKRPGFSVELVKVPLNASMGNGRIGVMVIGSSVLVYPMEQ
jgi:hypothetical protein